MMTPEEFFNKHYQYPQSGGDRVTRESAIHFADAYRQHIIASDGVLANVGEIPNGVLAKNKCEEIMQELDNLVVNKDHLPVFKNYFELGFEKCYNWIRVSSR